MPTLVLVNRRQEFSNLPKSILRNYYSDLRKEIQFRFNTKILILNLLLKTEIVVEIQMDVLLAYNPEHLVQSTWIHLLLPNIDLLYK